MKYHKQLVLVIYFLCFALGSVSKLSLCEKIVKASEENDKDKV